MAPVLMVGALLWLSVLAVGGAREVPEVSAILAGVSVTLAILSTSFLLRCVAESLDSTGDAP